MKLHGFLPSTVVTKKKDNIVTTGNWWESHWEHQCDIEKKLARKCILESLILFRACVHIPGCIIFPTFTLSKMRVHIILIIYQSIRLPKRRYAGRITVITLGPFGIVRLFWGWGIYSDDEMFFKVRSCHFLSQKTVVQIRWVIHPRYLGVLPECLGHVS